MRIKSLSNFLSNHNITYETDVDLSSFSYLKTGGIANYLIYPEDEPKLIDLVTFLHDSSIRYKIIGSTANLLFLDDENYFCLISTSKLTTINYNASDNFFTASTGVLISDLCQFTLTNSFDGFSGLEGIPGFVGSAIFMNAGAYGCDISDNLISVKVFDLASGRVRVLEKFELNFSYRNSLFKDLPDKYIILSADFRIIFGDQLSIYKRMSLYHSKRHKYQEFAYPTLGSIFSCSIYRELSKKSFLFFFVSSIYYVLNYKFKLHRRESPMFRFALNKFAVKVFGLQTEVQSFSDKDLNTLVNRGQGTKEMLHYISRLHSVLPEIRIENEIVQGFTYDE